MSRKQDRDDDWAVVCQWTASLGYAPYRVKNNCLPPGTVIIVRHEEVPDKASHPMLDYAAAGAALFEGEDGVAPPLVLVLDLSRLNDSGQLDAELEKVRNRRAICVCVSVCVFVLCSNLLVPQPPQKSELSKSGLGKAVSKALERLGLSSSTVVVSGPACALFMKLLIAGVSRLGPRAIPRLVLLHPEIPAAAVNAFLVRPGGKVKGYGNALDVDCAFSSQSDMDKRLSIIRASFPRGGAAVLEVPAVGLPQSPAAAVAALVPSALSYFAGGGASSPPPPPGADADSFDPHRIDGVGRQLYFGELKVAMHPVSKQYMHTCEDVTQDLQAAWRKGTAKDAIAEAGREKDKAEAGAPPMSGALVLRGSRCVLVRSLTDEWKGMRIPSVEVLGSESYLEAAVRSVEEQCDIDAEEIIHFEHVQPIMVYGYEIPVLLHLFYAKSPPPPGPLEDADVSDDEDCYDWYTYPRADTALDLVGDSAGRHALQSVAIVLNGVAAAGRVPSKWAKFEACPRHEGQARVGTAGVRQGGRQEEAHRAKGERVHRRRQDLYRRV